MSALHKEVKSANRRLTTSHERKLQNLAQVILAIDQLNTQILVL